MTEFDLNAFPWEGLMKSVAGVKPSDSSLTVDDVEAFEAFLKSKKCLRSKLDAVRERIGRHSSGGFVREGDCRTAKLLRAKLLKLADKARETLLGAKKVPLYMSSHFC